MAIFRRGIPPTGASIAGWVGKIAILDEYRSMTGEVRTTTATVHLAAYRTDGDASVNLCLSQPAAWTINTKKREQDRI